jgi:hypothetical protein
MFERFRRSRQPDGNDTDYDHGTPFERGDSADDGTPTRTVAPDATTGTAVADRPTRTRSYARTEMVPAAAGTAAAPSTAEEARAIQRERFGGADGTAIFFGWLSAMGLAALLLAVIGAAGTQLGFASGVDSGDVTRNADTIGIVGAALVVLVLLLAYYCGGYVAGRMARFDGPKQGLRVWLLGLLVTIAAAVAGWIGGSQYNVFQQLNLPRIPVDEGDIATGAAITLAVVLIGTMLAAVAGGRAGTRYHLGIDAIAWERDRV